MLRSYLKIALRNLARSRLYTAINVIGLAVGLAGCLLIFAYLRNETGFENGHANRDRIYRVATLYQTGGSNIPSARIMPGLAPALRKECPEVAQATRFRHFRPLKVQAGRTIFKNETVICAEPELFEIFTIPLVEGSRSSVLAEPSTALVSESAARKYFGDRNAIGQTIKVANQADCRIAGIFRDMPANTQLKCDVICSYVTLKDLGMDIETWEIFSLYYVYILLRDGADPKALPSKITAMINEHTEEEYAKRFRVFLQPLETIYLHSELSWELFPNGDMNYVWLFSIVALLILVIACANFINLTTARVAHRVREVGIRKVTGASRPQLMRQFLGESILVAAVATFFGLCLFELGHPALESFLGRALAVNVWTDPWFAAAIIGITMVVGVFAGSYPAFYMSRMKPITNLRAAGPTGAGRGLLRRVLVVFQFVIAVGLIFLTIAIHRQVGYFRSLDKGFDADGILMLTLDDDIPGDRCTLLKERIIQSGAAAEASAMAAAPGRYDLSLTYVKPEHILDQEARIMQIVWVDHDYIPLLGLEMVQGSNLLAPTEGEDSYDIVVTERMLREYEIENPIGFRLMGDDGVFRIIGVIKDFYPYPMTNDALPIALRATPDNFHEVAVKLRQGDIPGQIAGLRQVWEDVFPETPFEFAFLDDIVSRQYDTEAKLGTLFSVFAFLATTVACLGIFALSSFAAERRTKEIGIRKTLGATVASLVRLLSREFIVLVAVANLIAWPAAYYILNLWLQQFAHRMHIGWELFATASTIALAIAVLTVSAQAIKAARANPVETLRYE